MSETMTVRDLIHACRSKCVSYYPLEAWLEKHGLDNPAITSWNLCPDGYTLLTLYRSTASEAEMTNDSKGLVRLAHDCTARMLSTRTRNGNEQDNQALTTLTMVRSWLRDSSTVTGPEVLQAARAAAKPYFTSMPTYIKTVSAAAHAVDYAVDHNGDAVASCAASATYQLLDYNSQASILSGTASATAAAANNLVYSPAGLAASELCAQVKAQVHRYAQNSTAWSLKRVLALVSLPKALT